MPMINLFWILSALTGAAVLLWPKPNDFEIGKIAYIGAVLNIVVLAVGTGIYLTSDSEISYDFVIRFFDSSFELAFCLNQTAMVFLWLTGICTAVIVSIGRTYMLREMGVRRFFAMIFILAFGMQIMSLANNLPTYFVGWEFLGFASFFLVAFYYQRTRPVRNALTVFSIYRIGDAGMLAGMFLFRSLPNMTHDEHFNKIVIVSDGNFYHDYSILLFGAGLILAAGVKSAQLPWSYWLSRAMEGPTPSSAIFYGALAVHAGALLLIKLDSVWASYLPLQVLLVALGLLSFVSSTLCARAQISAKGRQAFLSSAQVGLIFAEIGLGWVFLAEVHIVLHAFYRGWMILMAPSVLARHLRAVASRRPAKPALLQNLSSIKTSSLASFYHHLRLSLFVFAIRDVYIESMFDLVKYLSRGVTDSIFRCLRSRPYISAGFVFLCVASLVVLSASTVRVRWPLYVFPILSLFVLVESIDDDVRPMNMIISVGFNFFVITISGLLIARHLDPSLFYSAGFCFVCWLYLAVFTRKLSKDDAGGVGFFFCALERHPIQFWFFVLVTCMFMGFPPTLGYVLEHHIVEEVMSIAPGAALLFGVLFIVQGYVLFKLVARIGMGERFAASNLKLY